MSKKTPIPIFNLPLIDSHCHLDYLKLQQPAQTVADALKVNVSKMISIAVSKDNLASVISIANDNKAVYASQGIHPHQAAEYDGAVEQFIVQNLSHPKVVAVGEIGLDYYYNHAAKSAQFHAFESQLELAIEHDLPVIIHSRDADADMQAILANYSSSMPKKGVIHSFTAGLGLAKFCLAEGFYLGFNGICTFKNAENVRQVLAITPLKKLLLETDAPYLTPVPYRGKENAPQYLPFIAEFIANFKGIEIEDLLEQVYANSEDLFFKLAA